MRWKGGGRNFQKVKPNLGRMKGQKNVLALRNWQINGEFGKKMDWKKGRKCLIFFEITIN
jgi:hypothetical protein